MPSSVTLSLVDGVRIVVPDSLHLITPYVLLEQQDWFEDEIKFLRRLLRSGQKIIDIGANYGVYTLSMAKTVGSTGAVWAFEPASSTAALLAQGIVANDFSHVFLERSALSSTCGSAQLSLNDHSELNALVRSEQSTATSETVSLVTLDDCLQRYGWSDIAFVKIDAEGEEPNILKGGARFFAELSPLIQYEIKAGAELHMELVRDFAALGYQSYRLVPGLDLLVPFNADAPPDGYLLNLFCCKADRAEQLATDGFLLGSSLSKEITATENRDNYSWHHTIAKLPYGSQLFALWEKTMSAGNSSEVDDALSYYAVSQDSALTSTQRFEALETSVSQFTSLCQRQPSALRLASLARAAKDFGARSAAVNALSQLANHILQHNQVDLSEPFLVPGQRFDSIPLSGSAGSWVLASILEECERLGAFSSFYTGVAAQKRLEIIRDLGFGSPEMKRRLVLLQKKALPSDLLRSFETRLDAIAPAAVAKEPGRDARQGKGKSLSPARVAEVVSLFNQRRYAETVNLAQALTLEFPQSALAWKALGTALQQMGRAQDSVSPLSRAVSLTPKDAEAHSNLGLSLRALGNVSGAIACFHRALKLSPNHAESLNNLGIALTGMGRAKEAVGHIQRALRVKPNYAEAHSNLGIAFNSLGQSEQAVISFRRALEISPTLPQAHNNLGNALVDLGREEDAVECYRKALEINPENVAALSNLDGALRRQGLIQEALQYCQKVIQIAPDFPDAHSNLGNCLMELGQHQEAESSFRRAIELKGDFSTAHSNLLYLTAYQGRVDPTQYLSLAREWELACVPPAVREAARRRVFAQCAPPAARRLRIGYVSGDFRKHAVSHFIERLFAHHDRSRVEVFAYSSYRLRDAVTERIQALVDHWVPIFELSDEAARDRMEADGIDVLIDLSGHTAGSRLGIFARRAAPVQAHYLGYFASTGLTEMDYWIGDEIVTPVATDSHFSEKVWRLPRVWVNYDGRMEVPPSRWQPDPGQNLRLGSFHNLAKLTPQTLALWASVLHAIPDASLWLKTKALNDEANRRRIRDVLVSHGVEPRRIELDDGSATQDWLDHMASYDRLDVALDPVGSNSGATTNCDALWMGVPVIALAGDRMTTRSTASLLMAIEHPEWVASSMTEYVEKVVALVRETGQRQKIRSTQRDRMAASPLCDTRSLAMALEDAYFQLRLERE